METQEYRLKMSFKIGYIILGISMSALMSWLVYGFIFTDPNWLFLFGSLVGLFFSIGSIFSVFYDRIILAPDYVEVRHFFRTKRLYLSDIDRIAPMWNSTYIWSKNGSMMHISQDFENWKEVTEQLVRKLL